MLVLPLNDRLLAELAVQKFPFIVSCGIRPYFIHVHFSGQDRERVSCVNQTYNSDNNLHSNAKA